MLTVIFYHVSREGLIRVAFQSLQLVVTDFLPLMPCTCIKVVVDVAGKFGLQPQELNISLTAIGLLVSHVVKTKIRLCEKSFRDEARMKINEIKG